MKKILIVLLVVVCHLCSLAFAQSQTISQGLYASLKPKIVQIKILSNQTGEKASIGSGFVIEKSNLLATNYHVISQIATRPNEFYGQYRTTDDQLGDFKLVSFDVINDLAILRADKDLSSPMQFAPLPSKGAEIYSLGNPHDLGFVIVDGVNNGIIPKSDPPRVFFSASINSGMSGGPAVDANGHVVAINVAVKRQSGDISFLVPAKYLKALIDKTGFLIPPAFPKQAWETLISEQLLAESDYYYQSLQGFKRDYVTLGDLRVPSKLGKAFKCWSDTPPEEASDWLVEKSGFSCYQSRQHFISESEYQGFISTQFLYLKAKQPIGRRQFYRYVEQVQSADEVKYFSTKAQNEFPANCDSAFVNIAKHEFKVHTCAQKDKKREGLSSIEVLATSVDRENEAWIFRLSANGSTVKDVLELTQSILKDVTRVLPKNIPAHNDSKDTGTTDAKVSKKTGA